MIPIIIKAICYFICINMYLAAVTFEKAKDIKIVESK